MRVIELISKLVDEVDIKSSVSDNPEVEILTLIEGEPNKHYIISKITYSPTTGRVQLIAKEEPN